MTERPDDDEEETCPDCGEPLAGCVCEPEYLDLDDDDLEEEDLA